ncbi:MAG: hypothetical protein IJS78_06200 [Clostridia bacterium]|nr:hypothetical protein [Clostridia bacterium]
MAKEKTGLARYIILGAVFIVISLVYIFRLINLQVAGQDYYTMTTPIRERQRTVRVQAMRGEIFDRNGKPLVTNKYSWEIRFDYGSFPRNSAARNETVLKTLAIADEQGYTDSLAVPKYTPFDVAASDTGVLVFAFNEEFENSARYDKFVKLAGDIGVKETMTADQAAAKFLSRYGIVDSNGICQYGLSDSARLFLYRVDMELSDFSPDSPYTIISDVDIRLISSLKEDVGRGIVPVKKLERVFHYPGYASHILGRLGRITAENAEYYTAEGYPIDAMVGTSGVEYSFEEYLHGTDGEVLLTEDVYGNVISSEVTKEPKAGCDVYLTLDIDVQMAAEDALFKNIEEVRAGSGGEGTHTGEDCRSGALAAISVRTGEVLALASCPTYNLATYNEDFADLNKDERSPMLNRALEGTFQPGSTFKIGMAVGALDCGVIDENTMIEDKGVYVLDGFEIRCWIYLMYKLTHGWVNVTDAIQESCNYFFFEVGRRMTIEKMNDYMKSFGLGEPTGIELNEKTGILAGPEYVKQNDLRPWTGGDTLQAAIGQSYNLFTPLQISSYIATVLNDGTRYSAHLLSRVTEYGTGAVVLEKQPEVIEKRKIKEGVREIVVGAMKRVIEDGSVKEIFEDLPIVIGGKTGTAQVSVTKSDNAIFTAFAPFDDPEIVITSVLEQGSTGANAGHCVRDLIAYYYHIEIPEKGAEDEDEDDPGEGPEDEDAYNEEN